MLRVVSPTAASSLGRVASCASLRKNASFFQRRCCASSSSSRLSPPSTFANATSCPLPNVSSPLAGSSSLPPVTTEADYASLSPAQLRATIVARDAVILQLTARLQQLDNGAAAASSSHHAHDTATNTATASINSCCEAVVFNEEELLHAMQHGKLTIRIPAGATVVLAEALEIASELTIVGGDGAAIVGEIRVKGSGASLAATNIRFSIPADRAQAVPCIYVAQHGHIALVGCCISGARDGIYLCGQGVATLDRTTIANCVRGVFESHRCRIDVTHSTFTDNTFHAVLLGRTGCTDADTVRQVAEGANSFNGGRADVALGYNPMIDAYTRTYHVHSGAEVVLSPEDSTTELTDPTW